MIKLFKLIQNKNSVILVKVYIFVFIKLLHLKIWETMNKLYLFMIKLFNFIQMKKGFILEKVYLFVFIKLLHL